MTEKERCPKCERAVQPRTLHRTIGVGDPDGKVTWRTVASRGECPRCATPLASWDRPA